MTRPRSLRVHGIYAVLGVLALSCAKTPGALVVDETTPDEQIMPEQVIPSGEDAERTKDGLVRVRAPTIDALIYVKPPRPHLQRYDRMYVNMPQIRYKQGVRGWGERDEAELMAYFRAVFVQKLGAGSAWQLAEEPAAGVLFVRISLLEVDIDPSKQRGRASTTFASAGGGAILILEFFDSETAEPLFRYVAKRTLPGGVYSGASIDQARLKQVVAEFATDLSAFVETQFQIIQEIERREREEEAG